MNEENELYGLAYNCPTQHRNDSCPFMQVEHFTFREKVVWIDKLDGDTKQKIVQEHINCLKNRV